MWRYAISAALILVIGGMARADERRIATLAPEGSLWMKQLSRGAADIAKTTDGRITYKYYSSGSQGDERAVVRKMRVKQLDGAMLTSVGLGMIYPGVRVLELPYLFDSVEELDYVRGKMWPYFEAKFRDKGFVVLSQGDIGWIHVFSTRTIESMDDLATVKIWAWQDDPIARHLFERMGLAGVPMGVPEVLPALQSGRIEACYGSHLAAVALQWHTKLRYMSDEPISYAIGAVVLRLDSWESGSDADRTAQLAVGAELTDAAMTQIRKDNVRARKAMLQHGLEIMPIPSDVTAKLRREAEALYKELVGKVYTQEELDMVLGYRAEYRRKAAR